MTSREPNAFSGDGVADDYDVVVDWERRLTRETPFFQDLFEGADVQRVVDLGCGTGKHAIEFVRQGLDVVCVDPSEKMLEQARGNAEAAGLQLDLRVGGFGDLTDLLDEPLDAVVCLGNAFMHVEGPEGVRDALADIAAVLRPGGLLVLHFLNHDRLLAQRPRTMSTRFRQTPDGDRVFVRLLDYDEETIGFEFVTLARRADGGWETTSRRSRHVPLPTASVRDALESAGFERVEAFGTHDGTPFDIDRDESIILVGYRG